MSSDAAALGRWLRIALLASGAVLIGVFAHALFFSAEVPFLVGGPGPWITAPRAIDTQLVVVDPADPPRHVFVRRFDATGSERATLEARGLTTLEVELNGRRIEPEDDARAWRSPRRFDASSALRAGRNELRIAVTHPKGPPVLQAQLALGDRRIETNVDWQVMTPRSNPQPAARADDTRLHPDAFLLPEPGQVLALNAVTFGLIFAVCFGVAGAVEWLRPAWLTRQAVAASSAFALVLWLGILFTKTAALPAIMGFDAPAHMHYVELIRQGGRLPLADEGFSTYHPPLAHATSALLAAATGTTPESTGAGLVHRVVPFASGLACLLFVGLTARRLWPADDRRVATAIAFAAVIPVGVYMSAYLGNESMHAAWISGALYFATRILTDARARRADLVWLAALLAAALLTKFTALALAPLIAGFVLLKLRVLEDRPGREVAATGLALACAMAVLAGWFYARNGLHFGDPVVWNLDLPDTPSWWLQPGYHTPAWLFGFGDGVRHPFFAGFSSYWDGLYSTFWGDGLVAGMQTARTRHGAWNDSFMLVGYWLAMPATLTVLYGGLRAVKAGTTRATNPDGTALARFMLAAVAGTLLVSSLLISLRLPFYAQARASYLLAAWVPIALFGADGLVAVDERLPPALQQIGRVVVWGLALTLLCVLTTSFLG